VAHARAAQEEHVWPSARPQWSLQVTSHGAACDVGVVTIERCFGARCEESGVLGLFRCEYW
jgi:hypothetical protein